jgi:hypothetical protein
MGGESVVEVVVEAGSELHATAAKRVKMSNLSIKILHVREQKSKEIPHF